MRSSIHGLLALFLSSFEFSLLPYLCVRASQDSVSQDHPAPPGLPVPPDQRAYWFVRLLHFLWKILMNPILLAKYITRILLAKHRGREKRRSSFRKNRGPLFSLKGPVQSWFKRRNLFKKFRKLTLSSAYKYMNCSNAFYQETIKAPV